MKLISISLLLLTLTLSTYGHLKFEDSVFEDVDFIVDVGENCVNGSATLTEWYTGFPNC